MSAAAMVGRRLVRHGRAASYSRYAGTTGGDRGAGTLGTVNYDTALGVRVLRLDHREVESGDTGEQATARFAIGGAELTAAGVATLQVQDRIVVGSTTYQLQASTLVEDASGAVYHDVMVVEK